MSVVVKEGDILRAVEPFLLHQCNCMSKSARGVAKSLFQRYPAANTYTTGYKRVFGTASFHPTGENTPTIINAYAQRTPGKFKSLADLEERKHTLEKILLSLPHHVKDIAIPWRIGCGLAGGDWNEYFAMLTRCAEIRQLRLVLYKFSDER